MKNGQENMLPFGEAAFNQLYSNYKSVAKKKVRTFEITKSDFKRITKKVCAYCGIKPTQVLSPKELNGSYTYNGIDRIDNSKGYELDNVVPCCGQCNKAKMDMSVKEFLSLAERISEHRYLI